MTSLRVGAVQAEPAWLDIEKGTEKTVGLIAEAAAQGVDLLAFPEVWIPGYPVFLWSHPVMEQMPFVGTYHQNSPTVDGTHMEQIRAAARKHSVNVVIGFSERAAGSLYMAQTVISADGDVVFHRRKLKPTHAERTLFGEGDGSDLKVAEVAGARVGALNCWEHLQPLVKFAMYAQHEQIHVAAWPCFGILKQVPALSSEANMAATQTYALEGSTFVVAPSQIMSPEGAPLFALPDGSQSPVIQTGGGTARVYGPDSSRLTEPLDEHTEGIVVADIDLAAIAFAKNAADPVGHYARPDVVRLLLDDRRRTPVVTPAGAAGRDLFPPLAPIAEPNGQAMAPAAAGADAA